MERIDDFCVANSQIGYLFFAGGSGVMGAQLPNCPRCESHMLEGPRPLMRIFGDVRAFECLACDYILLLKHPFEPLLFDHAIELKVDAAE
jgi:hypothetical protein